MLVSYWKDMDKYLKWQKYLILGFLLAFQTGIFLALKFYFFDFFNKNVTNDADTQVPATTENSSSSADTAPTDTTIADSSSSRLLLF